MNGEFRVLGTAPGGFTYGLLAFNERIFQKSINPLF